VATAASALMPSTHPRFPLPLSARMSLAWHPFLYVLAVTSMALALQPACPGAEAADEPLPAAAVARLGTARFRQGSSIVYVRYPLDGKAVVAVGREAPSRVWDSASGKLIRAISCERYEELRPARWTGTPHGEPVAVSPDGRNLLVGYGGKLVLLDIASG